MKNNLNMLAKMYAAPINSDSNAAEEPNNVITIRNTYGYNLCPSPVRQQSNLLQTESQPAQKTHLKLHMHMMMTQMSRREVIQY